MMRLDSPDAEYCVFCGTALFPMVPIEVDSGVVVLVRECCGCGKPTIEIACADATVVRVRLGD